MFTFNCLCMAYATFACLVKTSRLLFPFHCLCKAYVTILYLLKKIYISVYH